MKQWVDILKSTFREFNNDEATWKAAALAYYTVFALPPLLVLLLQAASVIWDPADVRETLTGEFRGLMGQDVGRQVETMIAGAEQKTTGTGMRLLLSFGGLLFGATGAFVSLQTALNRAWEVAPDPKRGGIRNFITKRLLSLGMLLGIAFLLLVSLALTAVLSAAGGVLFGWLGETVGQVINFVFSFAVVAFLFGAMFKVLPDAKIEWRDVRVGAIATAALFVIGKFLIGFYIGRSDPGSAFGAAGSLAVLLIWIYYAAVIVLLGAEFTQAWARAHGRTIEPEEGAVRVVEHKQRVEEPAAASPRAAFVAGPPDAESRASANRREPMRKPSESMQDVQREMAETRNRMSKTIAAVDSRVSTATDTVKEKVDLVAAVREHPWTALAAAVVAGVALSATRADSRAAGATVRAAQSASQATVDGAKQLVESVREGRDGPDESAAADDGFIERAKSAATGAVQRQARELEQELTRAADELTGAAQPERAVDLRPRSV